MVHSEIHSKSGVWSHRVANASRTFTAFYIDPEEPSVAFDELEIPAGTSKEALVIALDHLNDLPGNVRLRGLDNEHGLPAYDFGVYGKRR